MTNNEKIARWAGLDSHICDENAFHCDDCDRGSMQTPDYSTDAEAISLLNVLVEKRYTFSIDGYKDSISVGISNLPWQNEFPY